MTESYTDYYEASDLFHGTMMHAMGSRLDILLLDYLNVHLLLVRMK